jgi:ABC-type transport system involved in multi-copper enzyme maturation permease subunit
MDSSGSISTLGTRLMPFLAILRHDLRSLAGSWLVRLWLAAAFLLTFALTASTWRQFQTAPMIASLLFPWLVFPWFVVVMVLGVNPLTGSRAESLADGFLSRPIARYEYLLALWAARVLVVLGCFLLVTVPAIAVATLANRAVPPDHVTVYGILAALAVVSLVLSLQVSLAFLVGTLLRRTLLAVVVLLFLWYPANLLLSTFHLEAFSPISLNQAVPTLLRQPWRASDQAGGADRELEMEQLARQAADSLGALFAGVADDRPPRRPSFFEREEVRDFSLTRVLLGYGIPTLAAIALATFCFCRRDM